MATATDPVAAIKSISGLAAPRGLGPAGPAELPSLPQQPAEVVQALAHQIHQGKQDRTFIVILSAVVQIPVELERQFLVIEHELPGRRQLEEIARGVATEPGEMPDGQELVRLLDSATGLEQVRGRGSLQPVAGPPPQAGARRDLEAEARQ